MDRQQAISKARNLRKGKTVAKLIPADADLEAHWIHISHNSISEAKRLMRFLGRGVALKEQESLPNETALEA